MTVYLQPREKITLQSDLELFCRFVFYSDIGAEVLNLIFVYCEIEQVIEKVLLMLEVPGYLYRRRRRQNEVEEGKEAPTGVGSKP